MNTLAVLLSQVVTVLQESGYCGAVHVLETHPFSGRQFALKVRAELVSGGALQIHICRNGDYGIIRHYHDLPIRSPAPLHVVIFYC